MEDAVVQNKVALVTGAGSGLGRATVAAFAGAGYGIAALDRDGEALSRLIGELPASGGGHLALTCDVGDAGAVGAAVTTVIDQLGRADVLVNCAGIDHTYWIEQLSVEQWDQVIDVNLRGPFLLARAVWSHMRRQGGGHIVNIASTSALRAASGASAYCASKFGLLGLGRALNLEGRADSIRVTTIVPGGMRTRFFDRFAGQGIPQPDEATLQDPANVANAILFAVRMPPGSDVQELVITPPNEPGWP